MQTNFHFNKICFVVRCLSLLLFSSQIVGCGYSGVNPWLVSLVDEVRKVEVTQDNPLLMTFRTVKINGQVKLRCRIRNISANPIKLSYEELPWNNSRTIQIVPIGLDGHALRIEPAFFTSRLIADPEAHENVPPGGSLEGDFDLKNYFGSYDSFPSNEDVLLLWSYAQGRYTGMVPFRKS